MTCRVQREAADYLKVATDRSGRVLDPLFSQRLPDPRAETSSRTTAIQPKIPSSHQPSQHISEPN